MWHRAPITIATDAALTSSSTNTPCSVNAKRTIIVSTDSVASALLATSMTKFNKDAKGKIHAVLTRHSTLMEFANVNLDYKLSRTSARAALSTKLISQSSTPVAAQSDTHWLTVNAF